MEHGADPGNVPAYPLLLTSDKPTARFEHTVHENNMLLVISARKKRPSIC
jgi:hypothetical protein